jgi:alpha-mannosidase
VTTLELRTGEAFLRVEHEIDNRSRDHRVRAHFPLPAPVAGSRADCAFAVVERGLETEGAPHEYALPTWVSRRFVDASDGTVGLGLVHDGLLEYEVVDDGTELALTLFRGTGYLSRSEMYYRPNAAGPLLPVEGAQVLERLRLTYAVVPHRGDWAAGNLLGVADDVLLPLDRIRRGELPGGGRPAHGTRLVVDGAEVSALHRAEGGLALRAYNPFPEDHELTLTLDGAPATGWVVDLVGRPLEAFDGSRTIRSNEILSLLLAD